MPRPAQKERVAKWQERINSGCKAYDKWEQKYRCADLEKMYLGFHWPEGSEDKYVINLTYASVRTQEPSMLFFRPKIRVEARPTRADDPGSLSDERASLREDTVNTFVGDPDVGFKRETRLALRDAHFRFGVVEVGYSADWVDNPNAGKPALKEDGETPVIGDDGQPVPQSDRIIQSEGIYVKRIPAKCFRVPGVNPRTALEQNDWVAYYEWVYVEDVKRNKRYSNTTSLKPTGTVNKEYQGQAVPDPSEERPGMVRLWKCWDLRSMTRYDWAEGNEKFLLEESFEFLPFADLRFDWILDEFYPLPPLFNLISPQMELNETREMMRVHRKRFYRRYLRKGNAMTEEEWVKLESGGDGVCAIIDQGPLSEAVIPLPDADLGRTIHNQLPNTKEDFNQISGIPSESRGVADAATATQANIIDFKSRIRDTEERENVGEWLAKIGRLILRTIETKMALPFWIQRNVDPFAQGSMAEAQRVAAVWEQITFKDLGPLSYDVSVDIEALSPVSQDMRRSEWMQAVPLIFGNPALMVVFYHVPELLKRTLGFFDIRSNKELESFRQGIGVALEMLQKGAGQPPEGGEGQGQGAGPGPTPNPMDILGQLAQQMGPQ